MQFKIIQRIFIQNKAYEGKDRAATAKCMFGYYDGEKEYYFENAL